MTSQSARTEESQRTNPGTLRGQGGSSVVRTDQSHNHIPSSCDAPSLERLSDAIQGHPCYLGHTETCPQPARRLQGLVAPVHGDHDGSEAEGHLMALERETLGDTELEPTPVVTLAVLKESAAAEREEHSVNHPPYQS